MFSKFACICCLLENIHSCFVKRVATFYILKVNARPTRCE